MTDWTLVRTWGSTQPEDHADLWPGSSCSLTTHVATRWGKIHAWLNSAADRAQPTTVDRR